MKDSARQQFRAAPHTSGQTVAKPKDYEPGGAVEAASPYAAWVSLRTTEAPLEIGDILEADGALGIFKFVGFEEARWWEPEPKPEAITAATAGGEASAGSNPA